MNRCPSHTNNSADGYERWLENMDIDLMIDYANEFKNDALTDYHNHIVEMTNKKSQEYNGYEYSSVDHIAEASHY